MLRIFKGFYTPIIAVFLLCGVTKARASRTEEQTPDVRKIFTAVRLESDIIRIDGRMTEKAWFSVPAAEDFIQRDPDEGQAASERTAFKVLYDDKNLYVLARAYDSEPQKIKGILTRRDEESPSDMIAISIDSYSDKRTAFEFGLNSVGVKYDLIRFDDDYIDSSWEPIWYGAVSIDSSGWLAEFRIPMKELRFSAKENQNWGFQVYRHISRKNENVYWTYWPKNESGWVSHYGKIDGISFVPRQRKIYVTPYSTGNTVISRELVNDTHPEKYDLTPNLGADIKVGLSNNLTLDMSLNPDFGQIEADPGVLNLTAFETYFPEKRPFFIEGQNIFRFNFGYGDGDNSQETLFYSRRIGRTPQRDLEDEVDDDVFVQAPHMTTILGAGKITGKTDNGLSVGILNAVTQRERGKFIYSSEDYDEIDIEPLTNYTVARLQKDFHDGLTTVGGMFTSTLRRIDDPGLEFLRDQGFTGGLDLNHRFNNQRYMLDAGISMSHVHGSREAILETQQNSQHYFQRPDANYLTLDSSRTTLTGSAVKFMLAKIGGGHWRWAVGGNNYSPEFEIGDLGYLQTVDQVMQFLWIAYCEQEPGKLYRSYQINFNQWTGWNYAGQSLFKGLNVNANGLLLNYWFTYAGIGYQLPGLNQRLLRGGPAILTPPRINIWAGISSDERKKISGELEGFGWVQKDKTSTGFQIDPSITLRPAQNFRATIQPRYFRYHDLWEWGGSYEDDNGTQHYIFAELNQHLVSMVLRLDFTISPTFSIQYYAEPFLTAGKYTDQMEVVAPKAKNSWDRFYRFQKSEIQYFEDYEAYGIDKNHDGTYEYYIDNYDFNYKQYRSNLVLRWEYLPGSVLFLVWSQGCDHSTSIGEFNFNDDLKTLFRANVENIFMIKVSYLIDL